MHKSLSNVRSLPHSISSQIARLSSNGYRRVEDSKDTEQAENFRRTDTNTMKQPPTLAK